MHPNLNEATLEFICHFRAVKTRNKYEKGSYPFKAQWLLYVPPASA
jgi:hypothetical protein